MKKQNVNRPIEIEKFIQSILTLSGLRRGKDYTLKKRQLRIKKHPLRGKVLSTLRELYPEYTYYWETPQILRWY